MAYGCRRRFAGRSGSGVEACVTGLFKPLSKSPGHTPVPTGNTAWNRSSDSQPTPTRDSHEPSPSTESRAVPLITWLDVPTSCTIR
jgi:hypothetical protein